MKQDPIEDEAVTGPQQPTGEDDPTMAEDAGDAAFAAAEKKPLNASALVMLAFLAVGAAGIYYMRWQSGPRAAQAATPEAVQANATISQFLNDGGKSLRAMQEMLRNTEKVVQQFANFPSAAQVPPEKLQTDPFLLQLDKGENAAEIAIKRAEEEAKLRAEKDRQEILAAVRKLRLQSVLHSSANRACMINNSLYREGQQVDSFTIVKIKPGAVEVKRGAYAYELRMEK